MYFGLGFGNPPRLRRHAAGGCGLMTSRTPVTIVAEASGDARKGDDASEVFQA
jgi:hypothetical protein